MDFKDTRKEFYRKMLLIGIPVVMQNLISLGLNFIDTLMIGLLGEAELAGVGAANQVFFIFIIAIFGFLSGASVYTAQYWGQGDISGVRKILGIDYTVGFFITLIFTIAALAIPETLVGLFSSDPRVISFGCDYIRIVSFSYILSALSYSISFNSRAIQRLMIPTLINGIAVLSNAVLNYILIFGKLGFPAMGVKGAAVATLLARGMEAVALIIVVYAQKNHPMRASIKELFSYSRELFGRVMKTAIPVLLSESSWSVSVAVIFAAYGLLGTSSLAVTQITNVVSDLLQSVFFGIGNATMVIIGEHLGRREKDRAYYLGNLSLKVVMIVNVIITILFALLAKPIAGIYDFSPDTTNLLIKALWMQAALITPKMLAYIFIVGILRAGGDTLFTLKLDSICNLLYQVPMAFFAVLVLKVDLPIAMLLVSSAEVIKIIACYPRFKSGKWLNTVT